MNLSFKKILDFYLGGLLILVLRPLTIIMGKLLDRDHDPAPRGDIAVIKMLGGGSLVIAAGALLAIKKAYPGKKLKLVTTPGVVQFAKSLNLFDEILVIEDKNFLSLILSSFKTLTNLFRIDTVIDYEVYSRLTTIFALFTCARNRIGFYRESVEARKNFSTHTIYFNLYYGSWYFYEEISKLMECPIPNELETRNHFIKSNDLQIGNDKPRHLIGIGHGCSDLSKERMLKPSEWALLANRKLDRHKSYEIHFYGVKQDHVQAQAIEEEISKLHFDIKFYNHCGEYKLIDSIKALSEMDEFWAIDSSLLHYSRLIGLRTTSIFGPTSPQSLIKPFSYLDEEIIYQQIPCSPCVHVTETPPCNGNNTCIQNLFK